MNSPLATLMSGLDSDEGRKAVVIVIVIVIVGLYRAHSRRVSNAIKRRVAKQQS